MLFIDNKYTNWYNAIIDRAKIRSLPGNMYTEKHHIIPRSLGGGNGKSNLAILTPREHFICHKLLTKMVDGLHRQKMVFGLWRMAVPVDRRHRITSTEYNKIRATFCDENSKKHKGKIIPAEAIAKRRETLLSRYGTAATFSAHSDETKRKIGAKNKGRKHTQDELTRMRESHLGARNSSAKLNEQQVLAIRSSNKSTLELSEEYNVSRSLIYKVINRDYWSHI